jgi:AcrR family transcriptional regulator
MSPATRRSSHTPYRPYPGKLPRGPHSLTREQVAANQRLRVGMAMLEAVGENGYVATTVSEVVARAGVSRKAFYQHFANKEECFLVTYDEIVKEGRRRIAQIFRDSEGHPDRMETALRAVFEASTENPDALRLAITEIAAVGPAGIERRERSMADYAWLIQESLKSSREGRDGAELPELTLRAIVGGFNKVLLTSLGGGRGAKPLELVPDLARWAASYYPAPPAYLQSLAAARAMHKREHPAQPGGRAPGTLTPRHSERRRIQRVGPAASRSFIVHNQRERILDAVANLTASNGYGALRVEEIAAEASVSLQAFYEHFESKEDAFLVAYELGHARGFDIFEQSFARADDWRTGVRDGLANLMVFLASEPAFARLALTATMIATPRAHELSSRGVAAYAQLLSPGFGEAPRRLRPPPIVLDAIAGGLRELFLSYAVAARIRELPELIADATYVALTPFIGTQAAAQVALEPAKPLQ